MLDRLIRLSLEHRMLVLVAAAALLVYGAIELGRRPVDIFPDLSQPTVTVLAEAPGLAPDEMEILVTIPLESALGGAPGVEHIRSTSGDGLSIVRADFGWRTDIFRDRQVVQERLQLAREDLPDGVVPEMAPVSSLLGEVLDLGLTSPDGSVSPMELQTLAEWVVRRRLLSVPGVSQVVIIGGEKKQYQVLVDPDRLIEHRVSLGQVAEAAAGASDNTTGLYLERGSQELAVRHLGRVHGTAGLERVVVTSEGRERPVLLRDVGQVQVGPAFARGAASIDGRASVLLEVFKQPGADTLVLTEALEREIAQLSSVMPQGVELRADLFRQATFLQRGVDNVIEALRDGSILVLIVIFLFLFQIRASLITLVALPLSFATAGVVFALLDLSINTMTLGGLAIAVGELVDDAIVGVENVVRRLRQERELRGSRSFARVVAEASSEVRGPIFSGTLIVVLVFLPLFALSGLEGRLFTPLALAYVISLLASMVVSLTVTPVLALLLFRRRGEEPGASRDAGRVSPVLSGLQRGAGWLIGLAARRRVVVLVGSAVLGLAAGFAATRLGSEFLPEFDEGTALVLIFVPSGTSLEESNRIAGEAERRLIGTPGVTQVARYTGRGEHDEHAPPVTISHLLLAFDPHAGISREQMLRSLRERLAPLEGVSINVGQPLAHRIDHLLSGVQAQIAIKVMGEDLPTLREAARRVADAARTVHGVTDLWVEPQVLVPQVHVRLTRERLSDVGLSPGPLARELEIAIGGKVVGEIREGERSFDLLVRLDDPHRRSMEAVRQLPVHLPTGGWARLGELARVVEAAGPNAISRDNLVRRVAVSCNAEGRSVGEVVRDLERALRPVEARYRGRVALRLEGQFESQARATQLILALSLLSLCGMVLILYGQFRSLNLSLQVLVCVPAAFIGGVGLLLATGQPFNVAALVGFVSLAGIATRNGILLVAHYLHLLEEAGGQLTAEILVRAGRERAAPVVMTALTTGVGLAPILIFGGETGREILFPVATVVIGGLITSTLFEFLLRPALFWSLGRKTAEALTRSRVEY